MKRKGGGGREGDREGERYTFACSLHVYALTSYYNIIYYTGKHTASIYPMIYLSEN